MTPLRVPTIPNSPLESAEHAQSFGYLQLRRNTALDFVENAAFDPDLAVYDDSYQNSQAHSNLFSQHMNSVLDLLKKQFPRGSKMVEVGCGKGDFVTLVEADGHFSITGYDATYEGAHPKIEKRYLTGHDRLDADVIVLRHVLEHVPQPHRFLTMLRTVFRSGSIYVEVPSHDWILAKQAFFDITYEHVNYFSEAALSRLFSAHSSVTGRLFGDQYQYIIAPINDLADDFGFHYDSDMWVPLDFGSMFPSLTCRIEDLDKMVEPSAKIYLWGAATKGCMFLVHCQNQKTLFGKVGFAIDINPKKCGKFLPGSLVPIKDREAFFSAARPDDLLLISNPNYSAEIRQELIKHGLSTLRVEDL